jgi:transcriptional regulator GlxA family with amidase domain
MLSKTSAGIDIIHAESDNIAMTYAILSYPGALQSNVHGWREAFALAARLSDNSKLFVERPSHEARLLLVPGSMGCDAPELSDAVKAIVEGDARGATIAAACAGARAILEAGIDRGRTLTTHWSIAAELAAKHPRARIDARNLVLDHGDLMTAGGVMAWVDLALRLIEREGGPSLARECARYLVWEPSRRLQSPYATPGSCLAPINHDPALSRAEAWIDGRLAERVTVRAWAAAAALGERTFERRWEAAYGASPKAWLRAARVEQARRLLEEGGAATWAEITRLSGYEDASRFAAAFKASTGMSPGRYRQAMRRPIAQESPYPRYSQDR